MQGHGSQNELLEQLCFMLRALGDTLAGYYNGVLLRRKCYAFFCYWPK
jgi:hypothetical protein